MQTRIWVAFLLLAATLEAQDAIPVGTYKGQWTGGSASGEIHITFRANGNGGVTPEVGFTLADQEVTCKVLSFKADGPKFKLVYQFDAQGTMLQSATEATVNGKTIEGSYKTTAGDQAVDEGTFLSRLDRKATAP